jgi:hypothetical protein
LLIVPLINTLVNCAVVVDVKVFVDVILGADTVVENVTLPVGMGPTIVHMKKHIIPIVTENWSDELVCEHTNPGIRINTVAQWGFVHYHLKELAIDE